MKAYAVFDVYPQDAAQWVDQGCAYVRTGHDTYMPGEEVGGQLAVLRKTLGSALGDLAEREPQEAGGLLIEFDNGHAGFPSKGDCYEALRRRVQEGLVLEPREPIEQVTAEGDEHAFEP